MFFPFVRCTNFNTSNWAQPPVLARDQMPPPGFTRSALCALSSIGYDFDVAHFVVITTPRLDNFSKRLWIARSTLFYTHHKSRMRQIQIYFSDAARTSECLAEALYTARSEKGYYRQFDLHALSVSIFRIDSDSMPMRRPSTAATAGKQFTVRSLFLNHHRNRISSNATLQRQSQWSLFGMEYADNLDRAAARHFLEFTLAITFLQQQRFPRAG